MAQVDVRRNDYISSIRSDLETVRQEVAAFPRLLEDAKDLLKYCKLNKLRKFRKVVKFEMKILKAKYKENLKYEQKLEKLLYKAEQYIPGRQG